MRTGGLFVILFFVSLCGFCEGFNVTTVPPVKLTFGSTSGHVTGTTSKPSSEENIGVTGKPSGNKVTPEGDEDSEESDEEDQDDTPEAPQQETDADGDLEKHGQSYENFDHPPYHGPGQFGPIGPYKQHGPWGKPPHKHLHFASLLEILRNKGYSLLSTFKHFSFVPVGLAFVLVYFVLPVVILVQYFTTSSQPTINIYTNDGSAGSAPSGSSSHGNLAAESAAVVQSTQELDSGWFPTLQEAKANIASQNDQQGGWSAPSGGGQNGDSHGQGSQSYPVYSKDPATGLRRDFAVAKFDRLVLESEECLERINCELLRTQKITDPAQKVERWFTNSVKKSSKKDTLEERIKVSSRDILKPCINYTCEKLSSVRRVFKWYN